LRVFNAKHAETLPNNFTLVAAAVSGTTDLDWEWSEGRGVDMEEYADKHPVNWINASNTYPWISQGGDFYTGSFISGQTLPSYQQSFDGGTEDLELDITGIVEEWISGTLNPTTDHVRRNHGLGIFLTGSQESSAQSYYTKRFFTRTSEYFYKRPIIEARWNSSKLDNYNNFFLSSSLAPAADNLNTIYLYNSMRGQLKNIPAVATNNPLLSVYETLGGSKITLPAGGGVTTDGDANVTGSHVEAGIYSAAFAYTGSASTIYPVWHSASVEYHTGSAITVRTFDSSDYNPNPKYVTTITNMRPRYSNDETARFRLYVRQKDWSPTIYTVANSAIENETIDKAYYRTYRIADDQEVLGYGTGSMQHTLMSHDKEGNYFDLDMSLFETDYAYALQFVYYVNGKYIEQSETFKFRVEQG
jgi:hypothetical protein